MHDLDASFTNLNDVDDMGVRNLIVGIVKKATDDWKRARHRLKKNPCNLEAEGMMKDCEAFFRSEYCTNLTGLDGRDFLAKLKRREEMEG
jgi:hypothetical protein